MGTEINTADQFPDDDKIDALVYNRLLQRGSAGQLGPDLGGAVVGVDAHTGTQSQQTLLGPLRAGNVVPLGAAHRAQKDAVGGQAFVKLALGQGVAVFVNGAAAHVHIGIGKFVSVQLGNLIQNHQRLADDLGTDAVAADHGNTFLHSISSFLQRSK